VQGGGGRDKSNLLVILNILVNTTVEKNTFFLPWRNSPPGGQGLLIVQDSLSHSDTTNSVGPLWTSDQPDAETSTLTEHNIHKRQKSLPPGRIRTHDPSKRAAADPRLRPRGHWDRRRKYQSLRIYVFLISGGLTGIVR